MKKLQIAIIKNDYEFNERVNLSILELKSYLERFGFEPEITRFSSDIDFTYKSFGIFNGRDSWGLDGIKERIRKTNIIKPEAHNIVIFIYNCGSQPNLSAWTYPNPFYETEAFIEIPFTPFLLNGWFADALKHETGHALYRLCWFAGISAQDNFDSGVPQDEEFKKVSQLIFSKNVLRITALKRLLNLYKKVLSLLQSIAKPNQIEVWASAIKEYEGWTPGSRSYRNQNPGNLKWVGQAESIGKDPQGFAVFPSYEAGWKALINQLTIAVDGRSKVYSPEMTLVQFFETYAPASDNNNPHAYAVFVARKLGVDPSIKIKELS